MKGKIASLAFAVFLPLAWSFPVSGPSSQTPSVSVPDHAREVAQGVFDLGESRDTNGQRVQGYMFVRYKDGYHHKPGHDRGGGGNGGGNGGGDETSSCYAFLSNGASWNSVEDWVVNPSNTEGLDGTFVFDTLTLAIDEWEDAADGSVDGAQGANILGDGSTTSDALVADTDSPNGQNEVYFGDVDSEGAIAVTIVWGVFQGPPWQRGLVEWDQVYDQVDFDWSGLGEAGKMDFENIAQHELGHSIGLGHPDDSCTEETMYRYADYGETKKQDLHNGDIAGTDELY